MQSVNLSLLLIQTAMTGDDWRDVFWTVADIIPKVVALLLAWIGYRKSVSNGKKLDSLPTALNGKAESSVKDGKKVDKL